METVQKLDLDLTKRYSYSDYYTWWDDVRRELIDGYISEIPNPNRIHQQVSGALAVTILNYLKSKKIKNSKVFYAPFDVRLPENTNELSDNQIYNVVQPDISVICDPTKLDERGSIGVPDFIIEIVLMGNAKHDLKLKFELYQKFGVREYWTVIPHEKLVYVFLLENNKYKQKGIYSDEDQVKVNIFEDLVIDLKDVFEE